MVIFNSYVKLPEGSIFLLPSGKYTNITMENHYAING